MAEHRWTDPETQVPCIAHDQASADTEGLIVFRAFGVAGIAGRELLRLSGENQRLTRSSLTDSNAFQDDLAALLRAAGLSDRARPASPHQVIQQELLPRVQYLAARERVLAERVTALERAMEAYQKAAGESEAALLMTRCGCSPGGFRCLRCKALSDLRALVAHEAALMLTPKEK